MMKSGVPLLQAFDIVGKGHSNPAVAKLLGDIKADVETGSSLSQAFRKYPLYFDALFCNLIGAGEQAGILDALLDRLATYKEKILAIKGKIKSALFYPIRSEEHTSELQSLMRISYAVFCLKKKKKQSLHR